MNSLLELQNDKSQVRMAFDMGARGAASRENIASYVNEAGLCMAKEEAISVFSWVKREEGVVCGELNDGKDVADYMDWSSETNRQESLGALGMREQFLKREGISLQILPPIEGVYNEGRGVLMVGGGERALLYGFGIRGEVFRSREWLTNLQKIVNNPVAINEQIYSAMRSVSFEIADEYALSDLGIVMSELSGVWQRIEDGRALVNYEQLKTRVEPLADKYARILGDVKTREGLVRMGVSMERELGQLGMGIARVSGCGFSNQALSGMEIKNGVAGFGGGVQEESIWKKPERKNIFRDGKWREMVKIVKCGFHWKNGGNCNWEPNDFVEVGSCCPNCKRKFICA